MGFQTKRNTIGPLVFNKISVPWYRILANLTIRRKSSRGEGYNGMNIGFETFPMKA
mgnify:CR=1 FL=1